MIHTKIINKLNPSSIEVIEFDLVICSSGYETRATFLIEKFKINSKRKVALLFDDKIDKFNRRRNDSIFKENGYELIQSNGDFGIEINKLLDDTILECKGNVSILIDYSSMTRIWYASILKYLKNH